MSNQITGIVSAAIQLGVQAILVKPKRTIGPFEAHVTLREVHTDTLEITDQPVEQGANISDHAFKRPSELEIECAWSNSPPARGFFAGLGAAVTGTIAGVQSILSGNGLEQVRATYAKLLALQASRIPFDVYTGKRLYRNMLIKELRTYSDPQTENLLRVDVRLREVIIARVTTVSMSAPGDQMADPESTLPPADRGYKQLTSGANMNLDAAIDAMTPQVGSVLQ